MTTAPQGGTGDTQQQKEAVDLLAHVVDQAAQRKASDIHLGAHTPAVIRVGGHISPADHSPVLTPEMTGFLARALIPASRWDVFEEEGDYDGEATVRGVRFRVNAYKERGAVALALRLIATQIPELSTLNLPEPVEKLADLKAGLVLVCGPTGAGKSTTLAAIIDRINRHRSLHILTIEDPIEYVHKNNRSLVHQREVRPDGTGDTTSFAKALRASLREDPDVILVGEMRDAETVEAAIYAAETGHLVFSTLHAGAAEEAIERAVSFFPGDRHGWAQSALAQVTQAVVIQALVPSSSPGQRTAVCEVLIGNNAIRSQIREGEFHKMRSTMQAGQQDGMLTFDHALADAVVKGRVDLEEAHAWVKKEDEFKQKLQQFGARLR